MIQMVLTLIRATRKSTLNCMSSLSVCLVPNAHCKRSQQLRTICTCVTDYTHKFDTHPRCKELLEQSGFSVSQPLVLCLRNAFDITISQTIKKYYRLQQLELRFVLQMKWYITHHIRAQNNETTLQCTEMKHSICSDAKENEYKRQFQASPILLVQVLKTMNCTFCLSMFLLTS